MILELFEQNLNKNNKAHFIMLLDPDKLKLENIEKTVSLAEKNGVDIFFIGSSLLLGDFFNEFVEKVKKYANGKPVILFPGNAMQVSKNADALLFMSLVSGRNPEFLINQQVLAAGKVKFSGIKTIPTAYMLVESGITTAVEFMSQTKPLPRHKPEIAVAHALASEMLGLKTIYLEAGSGAKETVPENFIAAIKKSCQLPIIVGGGINSPKQAKQKVDAGADFIVCGNLFEKKFDKHLIQEMAKAIHE
jgi:putative glycerol-1-phosphate prenyltransferase